MNEPTVDTARPIFQVRAVQNKFKTEKEGRPIFDNLEYVEIVVPGNKDRLARKVREDDIRRWPQHYKAFKEHSDGKFVTGTPIGEWSFLTPHQVATCKALNVFSVEALAMLPEEPLRKLGPGSYELQKKAKDFLNNENDSSKKIKELQTKLEAALARITELEGKEPTPVDTVGGPVASAEVPKKRGRPKKVEA